MEKMKLIMNSLPSAPKWMTHETISYMTIMGSKAYGADNEKSDDDFYAFCIPPIEIIFPHVSGNIVGFGRNVEKFEQHDPKDVPYKGGKFDINIYNIVKYFQLVMEGNPNMVDSLFTDNKDVIFMDEVGKLVKENRHLFLSQKMYHTFRGMMYSHLSRIEKGVTKEGRKALAEKFGFDTKDAYHCVRMALEMHQVLFIGDLDIKKNGTLLREIRAGLWNKKEIVDYANATLRVVGDNVKSYVVPHSPDESKIRKLLMNCLEIKFGSLEKYGIYSKTE